MGWTASSTSPSFPGATSTIRPRCSRSARRKGQGAGYRPRQRISLRAQADPVRIRGSRSSRPTRRRTSSSKVTKVVTFGAFVEIMPGVEGSRAHLRALRSTMSRTLWETFPRAMSSRQDHRGGRRPPAGSRPSGWKSPTRCSHGPTASRRSRRLSRLARSLGGRLFPRTGAYGRAYGEEATDELWAETPVAESEPEAPVAESEPENWLVAESGSTFP